MSARVPDRGRRSRRGFAAMDPEKQRRIARMGGKASHRKKDESVHDSFYEELTDDSESFYRRPKTTE